VSIKTVIVQSCLRTVYWTGWSTQACQHEQYQGELSVEFGERFMMNNVLTHVCKIYLNVKQLTIIVFTWKNVLLVAVQ
jgi:hypothetical protein